MNRTIATVLIALTVWVGYRYATTPTTLASANELSAARSYAAVQLAYANHMTAANRLPVEETSQTPELDFSGLLTNAVWIEPPTDGVDALAVTPIKFQQECISGQCRPVPDVRNTRKDSLQTDKTAECLCDPCLCPRCECGVVQATNVVSPGYIQYLRVVQAATQAGKPAMLVKTYAFVPTKSYRSGPVRRVFRGGLFRRLLGRGR